MPKLGFINSICGTKPAICSRHPRERRGCRGREAAGGLARSKTAACEGACGEQRREREPA